MGTSSSGGGAGNANPLIPSWIDGEPTGPLVQYTTGSQEEEQPDSDEDAATTSVQPTGSDTEGNQNPTPANRFTAPRRQLNAYVRSGGKNVAAARQALRGYSRTASGNTSGLARRMRPSVGRVAIFLDTMDAIRSRGVFTALVDFNLTAFQDKPIVEILSAIGDVIFQDTDKIYDNTQDDSITRCAYANTITRICEENQDLDLDNFTSEEVEVMVAVFIEETIAQRVINDIGNKFVELTTDIEELLQMENGIYQIINGLVRTQIMPEISATHRGNRAEFERNIENIYRIAFDAMAGPKD